MSTPQEPDLYVANAGEETEARRNEEEKVASYMVPLPLWAQLTRFLITFLASVLILGACLLVTHARMPTDMPWLPDLMLENLPKVLWFEAFTNICIAIFNVCFGYCVLKMFVLHWWYTRHRTLKIPFNIPLIGDFLNKFLFGILDSGRRPFPVKNAYLIAAIRFLTVYMVMVLYRCVTLLMTSYPATDNHCRVKPPIEHPFLNVILTLVTLGSGAIHCGDLMFSGHTIILCLSFSLCWQYCAVVFKHIWLFRLFLVTVLLFAFFSILVSRSHYTNDIVVAAYSTITTFLLIRHDPDGAPWQLQMIIRYWPCPFSSENPEWEATHLAVANNMEGDAPPHGGGTHAVEVVIEGKSPREETETGEQDEQPSASQVSPSRKETPEGGAAAKD